MKKLFFSLLIFVPLIVFGQIINIPEDYSTIQAGIDAANNGDTVLVQPGVYFETISWDSKTITLASLFLTTQDTAYIEQTVIDANFSGTVIHIQNLDPEALFMGFTIRNGNAPDENGGGINMNSAAPIISDMIISDNTAKNGGGIFCRFSTLFLYNSSIINNVSLIKGGGINIDASDIFIDNCIFEDNLGELSGVLNYNVGGNQSNIYNVVITSCIVENNSAENQPSGFYIGRSGTNTMVNVMINDCDFLNNSCRSNGALLIMGDSLSFKLENCKFIGNTTEKFTAGAAFVQSCSGEVFNCLVAANIGGTDGGYYNTGGFTLWGGVEIDFKNCTFADNQNGYGGGMTVGPGSVAYVTNSVFWGNANQQIAVVDFDGDGGSLYMDYTDIQYGIDSIRVDPNSQLFWGDHNPVGDPLFVGGGDDEYALTTGSPCIDGGTPDTTGSGLLPYDILGNIRIWDGDGNGSAIIDMGAYEYGAPLWVSIDEPELLTSEDEFTSIVYPNPFTTSTTLSYTLDKPCNVQFTIYNLQGKIVEIIQKNQEKGEQQVQWNAEGLPAGMYYFRIQAGDKTGSGKMIKM